jgi:hypothetical protein
MGEEGGVEKETSMEGFSLSCSEREGGEGEEKIGEIKK